MKKNGWSFHVENRWYNLKSFEIYLVPTIQVWWSESNDDLDAKKGNEKDFGLHLYFLGFCFCLEYEWYNWRTIEYEGTITTTPYDGIRYLDMNTGEYMTDVPDTID